MVYTKDLTGLWIDVMKTIACGAIFPSIDLPCLISVAVAVFDVALHVKARVILEPLVPSLTHINVKAIVAR